MTTHHRIEAYCDQCKVAQEFTRFNRLNLWPETGYWTECKHCKQWAMFYRRGDLTMAQRAALARVTAAALDVNLASAAVVDVFRSAVEIAK